MKELSNREVQDVVLELMQKLHLICEKLNVHYFLAYGTLIGTIRHNGFIPWDDDLDIMMPREDYDKLINYLSTTTDDLGSLEIFTPENNKDYPYMIARVSDSNYVIDTHNEKSCGMGVFIDIYPMDGFGNDLESAKKLSRKAFICSSLYFRSTRLKPQIRKNFSIVRNIVELGWFILAKLVGKKRLYKKLMKFSKASDYNNSKYIGCLTWHAYNDFYLKSNFNDVVKHKFENYEFYIPAKYDVILSELYGDYMKLPPVEQQIGHHLYKTYAKN